MASPIAVRGKAPSMEAALPLRGRNTTQKKPRPGHIRLTRECTVDFGYLYSGINSAIPYKIFGLAAAFPVRRRLLRRHARRKVRAVAKNCRRKECAGKALFPRLQLRGEPRLKKIGVPFFFAGRRCFLFGIICNL